MFCPNCGKKIDDDAVFCPACGANVDTPQSTPVQHRPQQSVQQRQQTPQSQPIQQRPVMQQQSPMPQQSHRQRPQQAVPQPAPNKNNSNKIPPALIVALVLVFIAIVAGGVTAGLYILGVGPFAREETVEATAEEKETEKSEEESDEDDKTSSSKSYMDKKQQSTEKAKVSENSTKDYIIEASGSTAITDADLAALSPQELTYARNEIYARHGAIFQSGELNRYFGEKSWYQDITDKKPVAEVSLSALEIENADHILTYQNEHGKTYTPGE